MGKRMQFPQVEVAVEYVARTLREQLTGYVGDKCTESALGNVSSAVMDQFHQLYLEGYTSYDPLSCVKITVTELCGNVHIELDIPDNMQRELDMTHPTWRELFQCH